MDNTHRRHLSGTDAFVMGGVSNFIAPSPHHQQQQNQKHSSLPRTNQYRVFIQQQQRTTQSPPQREVASPLQPSAAHSLNASSSAASSPQLSSVSSTMGGGVTSSSAESPIMPANERVVSKCAAFFKSLLKFKITGTNEHTMVLQLLRDGVMSEMSAEDFSVKLREVTGSQDKGNLQPFLKSALPMLRAALRNGDQAELRQILGLVESGGSSGGNGLSPSSGASLPTPPPTQQEDSADAYGGGAEDELPPMSRSASVQPQQNVFAGNSTIVRPLSVQNSAATSSVPMSSNPPFTLGGMQRQQQQFVIKKEHQSQDVASSAGFVAASPSCQPRSVCKVESGSAVEEEEYEEDEAPAVAVAAAAVSGAIHQNNHNRSGAAEHSNSNNQIPAESLRNLPPMLLNPQALADRILAHMPDAEGVDAEVLSIVSMATEARLRTMLAHLSTLAEHRQTPLRLNPAYALVDEPRKQVLFMEKINRREHESRETAEKEALMRITKSKGKDRDAVEKAKQLQKADREAMVNHEANMAAFAALGGSKSGIKRKFGGANGPGEGCSGGGADWKSGFQSQGLAGGLTGAKNNNTKANPRVSAVVRVKRVTMRDLQHFLCNDPLVPSNSRLRYRIVLSTLAASAAAADENATGKEKE